MTIISMKALERTDEVLVLMLMSDVLFDSCSLEIFVVRPSQVNEGQQGDRRTDFIRVGGLATKLVCRLV